MMLFRPTPFGGAAGKRSWRYGPVILSHSPSRPSNGSPGPVMPSRAATAANTALRAASAVAHPFCIDSVPLRLTRSGTCIVRASDSAFAS